MNTSVSVIIPTFRRPPLLIRCLEALLRQTAYPEECEIIVVDDGNDAATREAVELVARRSREAGLPMVFQYLGQTVRQGPAAARNRGWKAARGAIIGFTDDDCIPDENWLKEAMAGFDRGTQVISGLIRMPLTERPTDYERTAAFLQTAEFVTANCFCRRAALETVGGLEEQFDIAWREDSDLQFKFLENNIPITRLPNLIVLHPCRKSAWWASLRDERKNRYDALLYKRHPRLFKERIPAYKDLVALYYALVISFLTGMLLLASGSSYLATFAFGIWTTLLVVLIVRRLWGTSLSPAHIAQVIVTSVAAPFLSVYWRLYGAVKYRTLYW